MACLPYDDQFLAKEKRHTEIRSRLKMVKMANVNLFIVVVHSLTFRAVRFKSRMEECHGTTLRFGCITWRCSQLGIRKVTIVHVSERCLQKGSAWMRS